MNNTDINVDDLVGMTENPVLKMIYELIKKIPEYVDINTFLKAVLEYSASAALTKMINEEYSGTTLVDYKIHNDQLLSLLQDDFNVIIVAHSQGNLFAVHAYEDNVGANAPYRFFSQRVSILHVAPTNNVDSIRGNYVLNRNDLIIRALDKVFNNIPSYNIAETVGSDKNYHSFSGSYLADGSISRDAITEGIQLIVDAQKRGTEKVLSVYVDFEFEVDPNVLKPSFNLYVFAPRGDYCIKNPYANCCQDTSGIACPRVATFSGYRDNKIPHEKYYENAIIACNTYRESGVYTFRLEGHFFLVGESGYYPASYPVKVRVYDTTINGREYYSGNITVNYTLSSPFELYVSSPFQLDIQEEKGLEDISITVK